MESHKKQWEAANLVSLEIAKSPPPEKVEEFGEKWMGYTFFQTPMLFPKCQRSKIKGQKVSKIGYSYRTCSRSGLGQSGRTEIMSMS